MKYLSKIYLHILLTFCEMTAIDIRLSSKTWQLIGQKQ